MFFGQKTIWLDEIENKVLEPFLEKCDASEITQNCGRARTYAGRLDESLLRAPTDVRSHRTQEGALEYGERKENEW